MKFLRISILTALHVCLIFLHTSCIREEMNACVQYKLNTQAVDEQGNDLTGNGILEKSEVYLFGEKGFIRMIPAKASLEYLFGNHKSERLTLVAWGNIKEDTLITIPILLGTSIENARLKLKRHTEGNHLPVTDMFYCRKELSNTATRSIQEESITLVMKRIAAGLSIHTLHLEEQYPRQEENYTLLIRGTGTEMDFTGKVTGENAEYKPLSITDEQGNVHVPPFRIFPAGEGKGIEIDIYRGQDKVCTVERDNEGKPLYVMAGKQTDIEIDFKNTQIKATVKVLPWGEVNQNTEI